MNKVDEIKTVADVLYEKKLINSDQLAAIKFESVNTGKSVESIIKIEVTLKARIMLRLLERFMELVCKPRLRSNKSGVV